MNPRTENLQEQSYHVIKEHKEFKETNAQLSGNDSDAEKAETRSRVNWWRQLRIRNPKWIKRDLGRSEDVIEKMHSPRSKMQWKAWESRMKWAEARISGREDKGVILGDSGQEHEQI